MASFISALSLLLVVLASNCFTLPIDQSLSNSSFNNESTVGHPSTLRLVTDAEKSKLPNLDIKHPLNQHVEVEITTPADKLTKENVMRASRTFDELFKSTTVQSKVTEEPQLEIRDIPAEFENITKPKIVKEEIKVELTTTDLPSLISSSSTITPVFTTLETSTNKYTGFLEEDEEPNKYTKIRKEQVKSKLPPTKVPVDETEEISKDSTIPTALFDEQALKKVSNIPNDFLQLDEKNDLVVTDLPNKYSTTTEEYKEKPLLNQGKKSSHTEEKKPDN
jgi:hypothetical protein